MKKTTAIVILILVLCWFAALPLKAADVKTDKSTPEISFGTLPVLQALPVFVAAEKGFFKEQGLSVNLVRFNSAMEKDVAMSAGRISGYFGDIMTPVVLKANKTPIKMVATIFSTPKTQRMFAIIASPKHLNKSIAELAAEGIAVSSNTVMEYLADRLLSARSVPPDRIKLVEIKNIPIRLQMLLSGQIPAAILPEPLATLAEKKGGKAVMDDAGAGLSTTILAFSEQFLTDYPSAVRAFLAAVDKASQYVNSHQNEVRSVMNRECRIPEPLQTAFPIPEFPKLTLPDNNQVMDVYRWLQGKKIVKSPLKYNQMVADGYLP